MSAEVTEIKEGGYVGFDFSFVTDEKSVGYVLSLFCNRNHPVVYPVFNNIFYSVLTQHQYISFLATRFGFLQNHLQVNVNHTFSVAIHCGIP